MFEVRLRRLLVAFVMLFALLGVRAFHVQVADAERFTKRMTATRDVRPRARRGTVFWADGTPMAANQPGYGLEIVWRDVDDRIVPTVDELRRSIAERERLEGEADRRALEAETLAVRRARLETELAARRSERTAWRAELLELLGDLRPRHLRDGVGTLWECARCGEQRKSVGVPQRACAECRATGEFVELPPLDPAELAALLDTDMYGVHEAVVLALRRRDSHPTWRSHSFRAQIPAFAAQAIALDPKVFAGFEALPRSAREVDPLARQIVGGTRLPADTDFARLSDPARAERGLHVYADVEIYPLRVGSSLIERQFDEQLRGAPGHVRKTRDPEDDFAWKSEVVRPVRDGADLYTTLRRGLQALAQDIVETAPEDGHAAAVVLDVRDGAVLALASTQRDGMNHARCPVIPGSVYKLVTAVAGLEAGLGPEVTHECRQRGRVEGGGRYVCEHHDGRIALVDAFSRSCNAFFAQHAAAAGTEAMVAAATRLGLAEQHLVDDLGTDQARAAGLPLSGPGTRRWYPQDLAFIGIGQGYASASPVQIATAYARVANGGRMIRPWLLEHRRPERAGIPLDPVLGRWSDVLREGARRVVTEGTARNVPLLREIGAAGKTGTAEVDRRFADGRTVRTNNAWFVGYAPHDAPRYCAVVVIEGLPEGQYGGAVAGPPVAELLAEALREQ